MSNPVPKVVQYRFGQFELDPAQSRLSRGGSLVKLQDLPFRLLVLLVERPGEIVSREEVRQRLWPQDTFVEFDNSLGVAVRKLREALRDDADAPRFVETVPRKGYRFLAPVTVQDLSVPADLAKPSEEEARAVPLPAGTSTLIVVARPLLDHRGLGTPDRRCRSLRVPPRRARLGVYRRSRRFREPSASPACGGCAGIS